MTTWQIKSLEIFSHNTILNKLITLNKIFHLKIRKGEKKKGSSENHQGRYAYHLRHLYHIHTLSCSGG